MTNKIVLFKGEIETLGYFSEQMIPTLEGLGYRIFMFDLKQPERSLKYLKKFITKDNTAVITFNFIGLDDYELFGDKTGQLLWDVYHVLCINIMVDHPFYYHKILMQMPQRCLQLCIDKGHLTYVNRFFPQIEHTDFLPLAGTQYEDKEFVDIPYEERPMDLVFTGNYALPESFEKHITRLDEEYAAFYWGIINDLIEHPWIPIDECMEKHLLENLEDEKTEENLRDAMEMMTFIDLYIRMYFRGKVIKALVDSGLKVHVFGAGWEELVCEKKENLIIGKACTSKECLEYIAKSKISLNVMPWFKDGAHDRIFNSMMNGSIVLTDGSRYIHELYQDKKHLYYYDLANIEELPTIARQILGNTKEAMGIAREAYEKTKENHTWKSRAEVIHSMMQTIK